MFSKKKKSEVVEEVAATPAIDDAVAAEPVSESVLDTEVEVEKTAHERVSGKKQALGLLAFIVLIAGAVTMIVNFGLGYAEGSSNPENWLDLVPIILSAIIALFTYIVICVVSMNFVKGKKKGVKIAYWVSTIVAYAFIIIPVVIDIVNVVKATQGN